MATQTIQTLTVENAVFYERALLKRLVPNLVYAKYAQHKKAPKKKGDTVDFRRFNSLAAATTPLTEGVTPSGKDLNITNVRATVQQYGDFVEVSDKLDLLGIDPVLTETAQILGEQAGDTVDQIARNEVVSGTNVQYAGGKASRATITAAEKLTVLELRKAVRTLRRNNAKTIDGKYYLAIIHPDSEFDLSQDEDWKEAYKYQNNTPLLEGEIGRIAGCRVVTTSNAPIIEATAEGSPDIYQSMVIARDAYGDINVGGEGKPKFIVKDFGSGGSTDPLDQRATSGWKVLYTAKRLQELAMVRIEHASSL